MDSSIVVLYKVINYKEDAEDPIFNAFTFRPNGKPNLASIKQYVRTIHAMFAKGKRRCSYTHSHTITLSLVSKFESILNLFKSIHQALCSIAWTQPLGARRLSLARLRRRQGGTLVTR